MVFGEDQVGGIGLVNEDRITGMLSDDDVRVFRQVVEEHSVFGIGVFGWG